ncbi:MAG: hypothetical protein ABSF45_29840 [Terriglobia bacterium]
MKESIYAAEQEAVPGHYGTGWYGPDHVRNGGCWHDHMAGRPT